MIVDFSGPLYKIYMEDEFDIPIIADAVSYGTTLMARSFEIQYITRAAVRAAIEAGIDPMIFDPVKMCEFENGDILFFTAKTEEWDYMIAGTFSDIKVEGSIEQGWFRKAGKREPHPVMDVLRKKDDMDQWQKYYNGVWRDDGPLVGQLEAINEQRHRIGGSW